MLWKYNENENMYKCCCCHVRTGTLILGLITLVICLRYLDNAWTQYGRLDWTGVTQ